MAAAAITPRSLETAFIPASFPGVSFTFVLLTVCARSGAGDIQVSGEIMNANQTGTLMLKISKRLPIVLNFVEAISYRLREENQDYRIRTK
jgi:hypothetical protein